MLNRWVFFKANSLHNTDDHVMDYHNRVYFFKNKKIQGLYKLLALMQKRVNQDNRLKRAKLNDELASCFENKIRISVRLQRIMTQEN